MMRALSIVFGLLAATARAELLREVFPVPDVVDAAFRSGGLAAFDPFDPWQSGTAKPVALITPSAPGEDAALLPAGACFDILPAWTARGFKPHDGTRVLYHPPTMLLFATIAPVDEAQVRAFCEWPPAMWMSETFWGPDSGVKQIQYRVTTYAVPATGAGGWDFRPASMEELLALPADARRMLQRQSMVIRGGQRSKVEGYATPQRTRGTTLTGMSVEAECTVGEDGSTVDLNNAPEIQVRLDDGTTAVLSSQFQQLIEWGNSWLMEAGTLPGNPPQRIFQAYEVLKTHADLQSSEALARCRERWTGRAATGSEHADSLTLRTWEFPSPKMRQRLLPPPAIPQPPADPFAAPEADDLSEPETWPDITVPELFGDVPVHDVTRELESTLGVLPGLISGWKKSGGSRLYLRCNAEGRVALERWFDAQRSDFNVHTGMVEATLRAIPANGEATTIWRGSIPIRSGQRSRLLLAGKPAADAEESPPPISQLEMEATRHDSDLTRDTPAWEINAAFTASPPLMDAQVTMPAQQETGTPDGVTLCRAIGRTAAGADLVLTIHLRETEVRSPPGYSSPRHDWWWRQQLAK